MDRSEEEVSGVPDSFRGDESPATKSQLWYQQEATRQSFQKLNVRLGETFDELRQANAHTQGAIQELRQDVGAKQDALQTTMKNFEGMLRTMGAQLANLSVRNHDRHSNPQSNSGLIQDPEAHDARRHASQRNESRPPSVLKLVCSLFVDP